MSGKRKRDDKQVPTSDVVAKPAAGTRVFVSGKAVKDGLSAGNRQCSCGGVPPADPDGAFSAATADCASDRGGDPALPGFVTYMRRDIRAVGRGRQSGSFWQAFMTQTHGLGAG
jgi:hypothetical protein